MNTIKKQMHPLKKFRTENRWKHKDVAEKLGRSVGYANNIERGCPASPAMALKLAKLCKCSKDVFLYPDKEKYCG